MKTLLAVALLFMSANTFALVCSSEDVPAKKLELTAKHNNMVAGETYVRVQENIFAGTVKHGFFSDVYSLFNHKGESFTFTLQQNPIQHCRLRVCPGPGPLDPEVGKLSFLDESGESVDEYFECL